jgi:hypothetical protein
MVNSRSIQRAQNKPFAFGFNHFAMLNTVKSALARSPAARDSIQKAMKKLLIFAATACLAGSAFGQGRISAPVVHRRALPPVNPAAQSEGSLQRGVRLGNPVQMFNPVAPAEYGDGHEFVTPRGDDPGLRPRDTSRNFPIALRLFSVAF